MWRGFAMLVSDSYLRALRSAGPSEHWTRREYWQMQGNNAIRFVLECDQHAIAQSGLCSNAIHMRLLVCRHMLAVKQEVIELVKDVHAYHQIHAVYSAMNFDSGNRGPGVGGIPPEQLLLTYAPPVSVPASTIIMPDLVCSDEHEIADALRKDLLGNALVEEKQHGSMRSCRNGLAWARYLLTYLRQPLHWRCPI